MIEVTPVETKAEVDTDSDDESLVYVVTEQPYQSTQHDNIVQDDDEIEPVAEEAIVPGNAGDDQDRTEEQDSEPKEDASVSEESESSEPETVQDAEASGITGDASQQDDDDDDASTGDEDETPLPRRSTRAKTSTATTKYKDFVVPHVSKSAQPDWMVRVDYLRSAAASGMFDSLSEDVSRAMLKLITKSDD